MATNVMASRLALKFGIDIDDAYKLIEDGYDTPVKIREATTSELAETIGVYRARKLKRKGRK